MQLTEDERAALERWRFGAGTLDSITRDAYTLSRAMNRLFPVRTYGDIVIRWDDEITPERLVACGFLEDRNGSSYVLCYKGMFYQTGFTHPWLHHGEVVLTPFAPRTMGELWQLMERCGIKEQPSGIELTPIDPKILDGVRQIMKGGQ